jgi:predicted nucleic acid-binding protein
VPQTFHVIDLDAASLRIWAKLMHGASEDHALDAMIAAVALAREMTVVTRNGRHFKPFGVAVMNPFTAA